MKTTLLPQSWVAAAVLGATLLVAPLAGAAAIDSPEVHHAVAASDLDHKEFYWDAATGRFAVALTFTNANYASRDNPPETETLLFHFPGVRHAAGSGKFVLDQGNGRTVTVAHRVFLGSIKLAEGSHLLIHRHSSTVRVTLLAGE